MYYSIIFYNCQCFRNGSIPWKHLHNMRISQDNIMHIILKKKTAHSYGQFPVMLRILDDIRTESIKNTDQLHLSHLE